MRVGSLECEGQTALRSVQSASSSDHDVLEVGWLATRQGSLEGLIGGWVHQPDRILQERFGVRCRTVRITLLIAVGLMCWNRHERLCKRTFETDLKRFLNPCMVRDA